MAGERERARARAREFWPEWWKKNFPGIVLFEARPNAIEFAVAFAASEAALARREERLECAKAVCVMCRDGKVGMAEYGPVKKEGDSWVHYLAPDYMMWAECSAAAIHERNREEKG